jgi:hypothetical protein
MIRRERKKKAKSILEIMCVEQGPIVPEVLRTARALTIPFRSEVTLERSRGKGRREAQFNENFASGPA